ncbi:collagen-like protein [Cellulomonas aerilata]|uniref:Uncharacterized protein n=1 Tax=Cellulomonas aerilata TaxID=515326 RepID=A0A512DFK7_9CELL|nr:collagen-like protein [Cellulomonas aerilata]GEO35245.1 hypothetical protein CAE01nite_29700 [Cellulomonas aerilata]
MSVAGDGLEVDLQAVAAVAGRIPVDRGEAAADRARTVPTGHIFGSSPAATSLAETWQLAVAHHRLAADQVREDLVELREALRTAVSRVETLETDAASSYAAAVDAYAAAAERNAADVAGTATAFVEAHPSALADEAAQEHAAPGSERVDGSRGGPADAADAARSDEPGTRGPADERGAYGPADERGTHGPAGERGSHAPAGEQGSHAPADERDLHGPAGEPGARGPADERGTHGPEDESRPYG